MGVSFRPEFEECRCPSSHPLPLVYDRHHLAPLGWGGPNTRSNLARACPTVHRLAHTLLNRMKRAGGPLPYMEAIRFGRYAKKLAETGWAMMMEAGLTPAAVKAMPDVES